MEDYDWVELPDTFLTKKGMFVMQVIGESMNKRIPNGSWCLFKSNPSGTRNSKIVLVPTYRHNRSRSWGKIYCQKILQ